MEQFLRVFKNVVRCTYTPQSQPVASPVIVTPRFDEETPVSLPLDIRGVAFSPRCIMHTKADGAPVIKVHQTVDGQRTTIENLKQVFDRTAWRAEISLAFSPEEKIFGLGQDENGIWNKRGHIEYLYQHNMKIPMPVFVSTMSYGVLFDCACLMVFDDRGDVCRITLECVEQADFYVITGSMDDIVAGIRTLTGRAAPLPDWALGYWQSKERYKTAEDLLFVANRHRQEQVPLSVLVQDWKTWENELWGEKILDKSRFANMSEVNCMLHDMGVHTLISVWPNMNAGGENHKEFALKELLLPDYSTYNAFSNEARALYWKQVEKELYSVGFDGWWCDNTEPFSSPDWCGETLRDEETRYKIVGGEHERYLDPAFANSYALAHAKGIYENQPQKPVVNLTRSGWSGIQQYGVILWAGDTAATWQELRREIVKGMSVALCGIPYWTVDAGAFFTGGTACWHKWKEDPIAEPVWFWHGDYDDGVADLGYQELYTRWLQFACFLPIFRSHGTDTPREFWNFDEPFRSAIVNTIKLRYRLMPIILQMAQRVVEENDTMMRSLLFDFSDDENAANITDEFMFGRDLLVCPVLEPMMYTQNNTPLTDVIKKRVCYLPKGTDWVDFHTNNRYEGGQTVTLPITIDYIPLFVRADTVLPLDKDL